MDTDINNEYLKELKDKIMNLQENEHYEFLKILYKHNYAFSENKNGIFINMTKLSKEVIKDINIYLEFCKENKKRLDEDNSRFHLYKN